MKYLYLIYDKKYYTYIHTPPCEVYIYLCNQNSFGQLIFWSEIYCFLTVLLIAAQLWGQHLCYPRYLVELNEET